MFLKNLKKGMVPMGEYRLVITQWAEDDIIDIGDYIAYKLLTPDTSPHFVKNLKNAIQQLKFFSINFHL